MKDFIVKNHTLISFVLLLTLSIRTCSTHNNTIKIKNDIKNLESKIYTPEEFNIILQIEGLKTEKRMIQSTDRKILDVQRQSEIDKEINSLEKKLKDERVDQE
jgi:cell division protein FtsL